MSTVWNRKRKEGYLLTELFGFLLQENGGKMQLDQTGKPTTVWTRRTPI